MEVMLQREHIGGNIANYYLCRVCVCKELYTFFQWKKYLPGPAKDRNFKVNWPKYGLSSPVETWVLYTLLVKKNCAVLLSM